RSPGLWVFRDLPEWSFAPTILGPSPGLQTLSHLYPSPNLVFFSYATCPFHQSSPWGCEVGFNKGLTSQDHTVSEVTNPAAQPFGQREFAVLSVNHSLSCGQVEGRKLIWNSNSPAHS